MATTKKKVWVNKKFEGIWDVPEDSKPHDFVRAQLIQKHGDVARNWTIIVAPIDGAMEQVYSGLEKSE